jgi:hypothetical protein
MDPAKLPIPDAITSGYLQQGVLGLTVIVLLIGLILALKELRRVNEARLAESIAASALRIGDQKEHLADNLKSADLIREIVQQTSLREETNKVRWDAIDKLQSGVLSLAQSIERVYSRQEQILAHVQRRNGPSQ